MCKGKETAEKTVRKVDKCISLLIICRTQYAEADEVDTEVSQTMEECNRMEMSGLSGNRSDPKTENGNNGVRKACIRSDACLFWCALEETKRNGD